MLAAVFESKLLIDSGGPENVIAHKLRAFLIPVMGILTTFENSEPEVVWEIRNLLRREDVKMILRNIPCPSEDAPLGIPSSRVPKLT